ncbi:alpha/beta hydrolase [Nocardioides marmoriginsengisoli]|uniref:Alpha/beta hydrolase n=1 Tax=Nocardioides marmoriginsengisoli TaxID=661483 RepID=A0A3N0CBP5_9ACTN|nr:alpha/beta hydrolase [Nocardioides marmoriginsengisoli]RNL60860.1 alpha/beta hydrolase [Nocardioides marmoriginsengisoli]
MPSERGSDKIAYGKHPDQYGVLALPDGKPLGLVVLIHGGFWTDSYGADLMEPIAADLRTRGYATWNLEYRRVGGDGGYPATLEDVAQGIDHVRHIDVDAPVTVIGHSAGGHLGVWAASRSERTPGGKPAVLAETTISLSGVLDLGSAAADGLGNGAVAAFLGSADPDEQQLADPIQLVPAHGSVVAVHARDDRTVPLSQSRSYVDADLAAGGAAGLVQVPGDHFALIDPSSAAWAKVLTQLG